MKKIILQIVVIFICTIAYSQNCNQIPFSFRSYDMAIRWVRNAEFKISDRITTSNSSWMRGAEYHSCDGKTGFFIYSTVRRKTYIHKGVPVILWNGFKNASSFGSFYDLHIKGRYIFRP